VAGDREGEFTGEGLTKQRCRDRVFEHVSYIQRLQEVSGGFRKRQEAFAVLH
jgi:hypothetical protein